MFLEKNIELTRPPQEKRPPSPSNEVASPLLGSKEEDSQKSSNLWFYFTIGAGIALIVGGGVIVYKAC